MIDLTLPILAPHPASLREAGIRLTEVESHDAPNRAPRPLWMLELPDGSSHPKQDMAGDTVVTLPGGQRLRVVPGRGGEPASAGVLPAKVKREIVQPWMRGAWVCDGASE